MAEWIWYPCDYEYYLYKKTCVNRYYYKDVIITPYWRIDSPASNVEFSKTFVLTRKNTLKIRADGIVSVVVDEHIITRFSGVLTLDAGKHSLAVRVYNEHGLPCVYIEGEEICSDKSFMVTSFDGDSVNASSGGFLDINVSPNEYVQYTVEKEWKEKKEYADGVLYHVGEMIVGAIEVEFLEDEIQCSYGETKEEALDFEHSDIIEYRKSKKGDRLILARQGFEYVFVKGGRAKLFVEDIPFNLRAQFESQDKLLKNAFDVAVNTLRLNSREFILDGAKRDRWVWAGDAYIASFFNFYTTFDKDILKRTISVLKARTPFVNSHVNNVVDYTLFWVLAISSYYDYTGDVEFVSNMYPFVKAYMDYCISVTNSDGFLYQRKGEMVFVDHCDLDRERVNSYVQVLFVAALNETYRLGVELKCVDKKYIDYAQRLQKSVYDKFYDEAKGALCYYLVEGVKEFALYSNIIAVLYDIGEPEKLDRIKNYLCKNGETMLGTPYTECFFSFALAKCKRFDLVYKKLKTCWGYMLDKGANTFWESNLKQGTGDLALYGRKYGKSLCHAWSAGPIAIIAKEFFGIKPVEHYKSFIIEPQLEYVENSSITVPINNGSLTIKITPSEIFIKSEGVDGEIILPENIVGKECKKTIKAGKGTIIKR